MTTPSCNAPLDIPAPTSVIACDIRCAYTYNYKESDTIATIKPEYLSLTYAVTSLAPVTYNNGEYTVSNVRIYQPSIHTYGSKQADAEMIIIHTPVKGGNNLLVCVPIMQSSIITPASEKLDTLMTILSKTQGNPTIPEFYTLNTFVGSKPFYSYTGSMFDKCSKTVDYIVFRSSDYNISISQYSYATLQELITANTYRPADVITTTPPPIFYNANGPNAIVSKDEIYIDCKPINKSEEKMLLTTPMYKLPQITMGSMSNQSWFQMVMFFMLFVIMIYIFYYSIEITKAMFQPIIRLSKLNI